MKRISDLKVEIMSSIIATILVIYFLEPILSYLGKLFISLTNLVFTSYQDRLYAEMASGSTDYAFLIILIFSTVLFSSGVYIFASRFKGWLNKKYTLFGNDNFSRLFYSKKIFLTTVAILMLTSLLLLVTSYVKLKTISTFQQHITVLKPHISNNKIDDLRADFALMRNREDYKSISIEIDKIADSANIKLPDNKLYPL